MDPLLGHRLDALRRPSAPPLASALVETEATAEAMAPAGTPERAAFPPAGSESDNAIFSDRVDEEAVSYYRQAVRNIEAAIHGWKDGEERSLF